MWKHEFTVIGVFTVFSVFSHEVWDSFIKKLWVAECQRALYLYTMFNAHYYNISTKVVYL